MNYRHFQLGLIFTLQSHQETRFNIRCKLQLRLLPDGVVCSAEIDEEVPGPVGHAEEVLHAA